MRIPVIVAAAGESRRHPSHKLLALYHGRPLLQWLLHTLSSHSGLGRILVVTGSHHQEVEALLYPYPQASSVHNPHWRLGLASSLRLGVRALPPTPGFLVAMGDTPFFSLATLQQILPSSPEEQQRIRVSVYHNEEGYPMYFPGWSRRAWEGLEGEQGARSLLRCLDPVERLEVDDPGVVRDMNQPEDFPSSETLEIASLRR